MARPVERAVRQGQNVDTNLPAGSVQRAAQTTRALGSTRVGGWVANNSHALVGLRALSRGLNDAMNATLGAADRQKQADIEEGRISSNAGETFAEQKSRGQQEGFLKAEGMASAVDVSNDLQTLFTNGTIPKPDGSNFTWDKNSQAWSDVAQSYLKERLKGLPPTTDNIHFMSGMGPLVERTMRSLDAEAIKQIRTEQIKSRDDQTSKALLSNFETITARTKPSDKIDVEQMKKGYLAPRQGLLKTYESFAGTKSRYKELEFAALKGSILKAASDGDEDKAMALLELAHVKRGPKDLKLSLADDPQYATDFVRIKREA